MFYVPVNQGDRMVTIISSTDSPKKNLTQEKDIFLVLSKRNVDEARIYSGGRGRFF